MTSAPHITVAVSRAPLLVLLLTFTLLGPRGRAATLNGYFVPIGSATNINLTTGGTLDWVHWGLTQAGDINRKSAVVPRIGSLLPIGTATPLQLTTNPVTFSWTNGTPVSAATNSGTGLLIKGVTNGFQLSVNAGLDRRRLQFYVAAGAAFSVLEATLSDGSAPAYYDGSLGSSGFSNGLFVIDFAAASADQELVIHFFVQSGSEPEGFVSVQAATLASNAPPQVALTSPTNGAKFFRTATVPMEATAADTDGTIVRVEYYQAGVKLGEASDPPYHFDWENPNPGNYALTALAVDNDGASSTSAPIAITILSNFPPSIALTNPVQFAAFVVPTNIQISATATDVDGFVTKVEFFAGNTKLGEVTNSPYQFTWTNPATGEYFLTARAIDNLGGSNTSPAIDIFITQNSGYLAVSNAVVSDPVSLDDEGPSDWAHWGLFNESSYDHKRGVTSLIPNYTKVGGEPGYPYSDNAIPYSWLDGTPTSSATNTPTGIFIAGKDNGFHIQAPAGNGTNLFKVYVGSFAAKGRLLAYLSDFSTPVISDFSVDNPGNGPVTIYTLRYASAAPGKLLHIRFVGETMYDSDSGNVTLQAAALDTGNRPPQAAVTNPAPGSIFLYPTNIVINADASDLDGSVTNLEFFRDGVKFAQAAAPPYNTTWTNPPLGNHVVSVRATDNKGLTFLSRDVDLFVGTGGGFLAGSGSFPTAQADLSVEGGMDWTHWGLARSSSFDHRLGATVQISGASRIGSGSIQRYADNFTGYSWTNGTPTPTATSSKTGIFIEGLANGFQVTVPADTQRRRLKIYVGLYGARSRFEASLSDSSARPFVDTSLFNVYGNNYRVYTIDYKAASPGQQLILRHTAIQLFDSNFGNVTLQSATLADLPPPILSKFAWNGSNAVFRFTSLLNSNYTVEYSDNLPGTNWAFLAEFPGTGQEIEIIDPAPAVPQRFYRVVER